MASIVLKNLTGSNIAGTDLFDDSESFMRDLFDDELNIQGGASSLWTAVVAVAEISTPLCLGVAVGIVIGVAISKAV